MDIYFQKRLGTLFRGNESLQFKKYKHPMNK